MQKIIITLAVIVFIALFFWAFESGLGKQERFECEKWQDQAEEYPGFYLTQWQKDQCDAAGVEINARVQ